jgi:hypothetical protein
MSVSLFPISLNLGANEIRLPKHARLLCVEGESFTRVMLHVMLDELEQRREGDTGWRKFFVTPSGAQLPYSFFSATLVGHSLGKYPTTQTFFVFEVESTK